MGPDHTIYRLVQQYFCNLRQAQSLEPDHTIYRLVQYLSNLRQEQPDRPIVNLFDHNSRTT